MAGAFKHIHDKHLHSDNRNGYEPVHESDTIVKGIFCKNINSVTFYNNFTESICRIILALYLNWSFALILSNIENNNIKNM